MGAPDSRTSCSALYSAAGASSVRPPSCIESNALRGGNQLGPPVDVETIGAQASYLEDRNSVFNAFHRRERHEHLVSIGPPLAGRGHDVGNFGDKIAAA